MDRLRAAAQNTDGLFAGLNVGYEYQRRPKWLNWTRRWDMGVVWHPADTIAWLFHYHVASVDIFGGGASDASLADLNALGHLQSVRIRDAPHVTDACIRHLAGLDRLTDLWLIGTGVSSGGATELRRALPRCEVSWSAARPAKTISDKLIADRWSPHHGKRCVEMRGRTIDEAVIAKIRSISTVELLDIIEAPRVNDAALKHLIGAKKLEHLLLHGTSVTAEGASKLQVALPECKIECLPPGPPHRHRSQIKAP